MIVEIVDMILQNGEISPVQARAKYHGYISESYEDTYLDNNNSIVKTMIDEWYNNNLKANYEIYLSDSIFCNDRSLSAGIGSGIEETVYGAFERNAKNKSASLICPRKEDRFTKSSSIGNGKLENPIGLITVDEIALAGGVNGYNNQIVLLK